ncbi:AMP-dependent synthetase/ligase [Nocardia sp. bgisy134]|uniref:AMP-dependent synthetase/ligase n=1 Tax=Nocardia sp. bgisy134 TaxID=3413789 RepID=UPI003D74A4A7
MHPTTDRSTLCHRFAATTATHNDLPAVSWHEGSNQRTLSWFRYREEVLNLAGAFLRLGLNFGDTVAIVADNRSEHLLADWAALHCGAVPVSVYPTMAAEQMDYVLSDCAPRLIVVVGHHQQQIVRELPWVVGNRPKLVLFEPLSDPIAPDEFSWDEVVALGRDSRTWVADELDTRISLVEPASPATIVYTSGTTGMPKGVVLTHGNVLWEVDAMVSTGTVDYAYRSVSHLPLAHVAERLWSLYLPMRLGGHVFCCPDSAQLVLALQTHRPSFLMTVPRVWEKLRTAVDHIASSSPFADRRSEIARDRKILREVAEARLEDQHVSALQATAAAHAREGVLREIRQALGLDGVIYPCTGAAPVSHELRLDLASVGIDVHVGYGMTETCGIATGDRFGCGGRDAVGTPLPGVDIWIAADGEILVRSPGNTPGYRHGDGVELYTETWLHTGDIGFLDPAGRLHVTDRRKELLITSSGKNIAPTAIETRLAGQSFLDTVIAVGNDRPYVVALLTVEPSLLVKFARERDIDDTDIAALLDHPVVRAEIDAAVERANQGLSRPEQVKKYRVLADQWSPHTGELTPTFKMRRNVITAKYSAVIEDLYR